ncbi:hypothetical protein FRB96_002115 [Tulasnella sp. 330]|nr:hypothetical protein FRB96_002115 [Tulasnella sp. 330]
MDLVPNWEQILALYEMCPHRNSASYRMQASASLLDNVIRYLGLVSIDAMDSRAPSYAAGAAPALGRPLPNGVIIKDDGLQPRESATATESIAPALPSPLRPLRSQAAVAGTLFNIWGHAIVEPPLHLDNVGRSGIPTGCPCEALSFSRTPDLLRSTPSWRFMPKWGQNGSVGEIEKEEARRLVWSTVIILGSDANARRAAGFPRLDLHISKPENFAILFPGEDDYSSLPDVDRVYSGKESNWALWARTTLLWFSCIRHLSRGQLYVSPSGIVNSPYSDNDKLTEKVDADFAMRAWMETVAIEDALDSHTCATEQSTTFQAREMIFAIRMEISGGFRHYIPVAQTGVNFSELDRDSAMKWGTSPVILAYPFSETHNSPLPSQLAGWITWAQPSLLREWTGA